ncbi:expansin-like B1 [Carya illinoinensis]|uniref:expansin-like B1 n=1 Tax=Carya illinoinensis TaxID=32201 RepID=UPI001C7242F4|nr:expansin-like B1 [Carya illinoinensis]
MGLAVLENQVGILCVICMVLLLPAKCAAQGTFTYSSRATYYGSGNSHGNPSGTCGYGEYGRTVNDGSVTGVSKLYRNATGCGACYQVRCTSSQYCSEEGVTVVVTDYGEGDNTDFILNPQAYERLARRGNKGAKELFGRGVISVEYRRVSCRYPGYNLMIKVHEQSKYPNYLAIVIIYAAGKHDITAVELCQKNCKHWRGMHKAFGAVWGMSNEVPSGAIKLRFKVSGKWVESKSDLPALWKAGVEYDSDIQLPIN